jgi:rhodanese-related sulfurtransferase
MQGKFWLLLLLIIGLAVSPGAAGAATPELQYIDPVALKGMMGAPGVVVVDVSTGWWTYDQKIPGSLVHPEEASSWARELPRDRTIVVYCG